MVISKAHFEAMLILLYNTGDYTACDELLKVYKRVFFPEGKKKGASLRLV